MNQTKNKSAILKLTFTFVFLSMFSITYSQNLLVLDDDPLAAPEHYATYAAAEAAAQNGDIIYVKSSGNGYGTITITKSVTLIGQGIELTSTLQDISGVDSPESKFVNIDIDADDVSLYGLRVSSIDIDADNTLIKGNHISNITLRANISNVIIHSNTVNSIGSVSTLTSATNVLISNNIISSVVSGTNSNTMSQWIIEHNTTHSVGLTSLYNSLIYSNLLVDGSATDYSTNTRGCSFLNNISANGLIPTGNGNQINVNMSNVFATVPGTGANYDDHFFLATGSLASNAGHDGTDVGITGGSVPAKNVGNAPVPLITELVVESIDSDNSLDIHIKAEAKN